MKISLDWISDFCTLTEKDPQKLTDIITEQSAEVEDICSLSKDLEKIVLGKIEEVHPHPNADKLQIVTTDIGEKEPCQIVCGGKNVAKGMTVIVATLGSKVRWHGEGELVEIKKTKIRDVESIGMICASDEISLSETFPHEKGDIIDASCFSDLLSGTPLSDALEKNDTVLEFENTAITNRPDLFSHIGFAREFVAIGIAKELKEPKEYTLPKSDTSPPFEVIIEDTELCSRYLAIHIQNISSIPSPSWISRRLEAVGIRSIDLIVDVTNYVMMEWGVPLHAFDVQKIAGKKITMRRSKQGETVIPLDSIKRTLPKNTIVLEDESGIFDLSGIMGGKDSGITEKTTDVWLTTPVYHPVLIRRTALALNHRTDASTIYEKTVPDALAKKAFVRAVEIIMQYLPKAQVASELIDIRNIPEEKNTLFLKTQKLERVLGVSLETKEIKKFLTPLGFEVSENNEGWDIIVPGWRNKDITIEEDLIEELVRIRGLTNIKGVAPTIQGGVLHQNSQRALQKKIRHILAAQGITEVLNFSFLGKQLLEKSHQEEPNLITLKNPLSADISIMRPSLLPYLLKNAETNRKHQENVSLFELAKIFRKTEEGAPLETFSLGVLSTTGTFLEGKSYGELLCKKLQKKIEIREGKENIPDSFHAGRYGEIWAQNKKIGYFGQLHPLVTKNFELPEQSHFLEMDISLLSEISSKKIQYTALPKFPSMKRDTNILFPKKTLVGNIIKQVKNSSPLLASIEVIDVYPLKNDEKSVTLSALYRSPDHTLTEEEGNKAHEQLLKKLVAIGGKERNDISH